MRLKRRSPCLVMAALVLLLLPATVLAQDVTVSAEGAYNAQYLDVYLYANINTGNLCSYGVKLNYNTTLLSTPTATKNEDVWYFGTTSAKQPYMNPDISTPGQIIFIGGKLDTSTPTSPSEGVTGTRVLLGSVRFVRTEGSLGKGIGAETYFGITAGLGKTGDYKNFVTTGGTVKDGAGVSFTAKVLQRGDANGDGSVNVQDMSTVRSYIVSGGTPYAWMNCNGDNAVNVQDMSCIRNLIVTGHY